MEIAEIKGQLTLAQVLGYYGLKPDKHLRLHCPFHEDRTPSMQVYYKTHTCYCFSSNCKTHGKSLDVIDFVMHKESCSKHEAILKCKELIGGSAPAAGSSSRAAILGNIFTYFKNGVHNSQPAREYLAQRGLDYGTIAVGYNSGQFHHGQRKDEQQIADYLSVGLLSEHDRKSRLGEVAYKPFAKYSIVFPLYNRKGDICSLYFRSTVNDENQRHYYLKDRSGLYPGYPAAASQRLILTESVIDAATLLQQEEITKAYSILACYGTNGLRAEHVGAIKALTHLQEIIFAFDGDEAGRKGAAKYAAQLRTELPHIRYSTLVLPAGEDINSISVSHTAHVFIPLLNARTEFFSSTEPTEIQVPPTTPIAPVQASAPILDSSHPHKLVYKSDQATYYVQGGISKPLDSLKVTLVVERQDNGQKSRNKLDLYEDRQVEKLCREVSEKLGIGKTLLEQDLYRLTDLLDGYRESEQQPHAPQEEGAASYPLTLQERNAATSFLRQEDLLGRLGQLLGETGIVGEETNRLFLLLVALSYKMPGPLHALIQGSSGSGKTRLLKQVSDCMPPERVTRLTRVSDKVLYNYPERYFIHRLLCLEDIDGLSEEAEFAFRELQSNGELNSATSIKLENGQITSGQKTVKGPIASLACTTQGEIYEDNMSRVFLVAVDESTTQTRRIIAYQDSKAAGTTDTRKEEDSKAFIRNLVRSLEPLEVINPYAGKLQLPADAHKIRRLHDLFLNFVKLVTLLHQYQRERDSQGRLIATVSDVEQAVGLMFDSIVLKVDELDGSLRQFYEQLKDYLRHQHGDHYQRATFNLREIRQGLKLSKTQLFRYAHDLTRLEYISPCGGHINKGFIYKLSYWDNYQGLRDRIKEDLFTQLSALKEAGQRVKQPAIALER